MFGEILGSVFGGLLGGDGSESSQTSNKIDDRLAPYVYGKDGKGGLLADVNSLYQQQAAQGGLNGLQRAGLESQRQVLASPQYTQGYDAMRSMGLGLMGGGVAQNPFTSGGGMGGQMGGLQQRPMTQQTGQQFIGSMPSNGMIGSFAPAAVDLFNKAKTQGNTPQTQQNGVVRPTANTQYQPFQPQQTESLQAMNTPIQSVAQFQAANPAPAAPTTSAIDDAIDAYMKANGLGKYATNVNTDYEMRA